MTRVEAVRKYAPLPPDAAVYTAAIELLLRSGFLSARAQTREDIDEALLAALSALPVRES